MFGDDHYRALLRRIAIGGTIVGLPLLGGMLSGSAGCACPSSNSDVHISQERYESLMEIVDGDGRLTREQCAVQCAEVDAEVPPEFQVSSCTVELNDLPRLHCEYAVPCGIGRRIEGVQHGPSLAPSGHAAWLASVALLEAEAVVAFNQLAAELEVHGAPRALVDGARRGARDEVRHALATRSLVERLGVTVPDLHHAPLPLRSLREVALDNAREGCVRETYGALVAAHQAGHARDAYTRSVFEGIARDEAGHGSFSLALAEWTAPRVGRRLVAEERSETREALRADLGEDPAAALDGLGLPSAERANTLLDMLPV